MMKNTLPMSGLMSHKLKSHLYPPAELASRARRLLDGKSDWDLAVFADNIEHVLDEYDKQAINTAIEDLNPELNPEFFVTDEDNEGNEVIFFDTMQIQFLPSAVVNSIGPTYALREWLAANSNRKKEQMLGICRDYEVFAVLALIYFSKSSNKQSPFGLDQKIPICPIWSMEALCYAEFLFGLKDVENKTRNTIEAELTEKRKQWSAQGNSKRHSRSYKAKAQAILLWEKRRLSKDPKINCESLSKAGNSICLILQEMGYYYEPSTITGWLRAHAKEKNIKLLLVS